MVNDTMQLHRLNKSFPVWSKPIWHPSIPSISTYRVASHYNKVWLLMTKDCVYNTV